MTIVLAVCLTLLTIDDTFGQDKNVPIGHLKKTNPDELTFVFHSVDCPGPEDVYERIVEGELLRARIKPLHGWRYDELTLIAELKCKPVEANNIPLWVIDLDVFFVIFRKAINPTDDAYPFYRIHYDPVYGGYGYLGDKVFINDTKEMLRDHVARLLTDYLKANLNP